MSAKPTLRVHTSCEPAITPTVILPMLSLANSAETSESTASIPLSARAGNVWQTALCTSNTPDATDINNDLAATSRDARHVQNLLDICLLIRLSGRSVIVSPPMRFSPETNRRQTFHLCKHAPRYGAITRSSTTPHSSSSDRVSG